MARWRIAALSIAALALIQPHVRAQVYLLQEEALKGQTFRLDLKMDLKGKTTFQEDGKPRDEPLTATARHEILEYVLEEKDAVAVRTARHYRQAEVEFTAGKDKVKNQFRPDRGLMVAHRVKDQTTVYSINASLTQTELELTEHFDTLHLTGLLPPKGVKIGESWKLPIPFAQALCDLDALIGHNLTAKLEEVKGNEKEGIAHLSVLGEANGIDLGAEVKLVVKARAEFDLKEKRLTRLTWMQSEQRDQGPASPALSADVTIELTRMAIEEPKELSGYARVPIPAGAPPADLTVLNYRDKKGRFAFQHARDWHLVGIQEEQVVLRLLDTGDFVAQATITPMKKVEPAKMLTLDDFAKQMAVAPGWQERKELERTDKLGVPGGPTVLRVSSEGTLAGAEVVQYFYLIGTSQGEQMIVTFTLTPNQVGKMDARDLTLVRSVRLESMMRGADEKTARGE